MVEVPAWEGAVVAIGTNTALDRFVSEIRSVSPPETVRRCDRAEEAPIAETTGVILIDEESLNVDELLHVEIPVILVRPDDSESSIPPHVTDVIRSSAPAGEIEARLNTVIAMSSYRQALLARTISQLELEIRATPPLATLARTIGQPVSILAVLPTTDTTTTVYVSSEHAPVSDLPDSPRPLGVGHLCRGAGRISRADRWLGSA
ncbi:MAG: hypothetical protein U5K37_00920 [Natrialbaceae archaeon]|nr:hypothetical protein [Natrialbaceae archaeon]